MQILFIGDSHANSLARAIKRGGIRDVSAVDVRTKPGEVNRSKEISVDLPKIYPADIVFCCLGGTEYNLLGLIESDAKFDFLYASDGDVDEARPIIPKSLIRKALKEKMRTSLARMSQAHALFEVPFNYVAPPPPFAELAPDAVLPTAFFPLLEKGIAPASIRMKLYKMQIDIMRDHCEKAGIGMVYAPVKAQDDAGFLLNNYWDRDPTHGNASYGLLVIDELRSVVNA